MTDARLQSLYRRLTQRHDDTLDADALVEAMGRAGYADVEGTPLDRIADSAAHADVLRTVLELAPDAQALSRELSTARAPRRVAAPALRWWAMAAALGAVALGVVNLRPEAPSAPMTADSPRTDDTIFSVSFEATPGRAQDVILSGSFESPPAHSDAEPIFSGDFDS